MSHPNPQSLGARLTDRRLPEDMGWTKEWQHACMHQTKRARLSRKLP